MALGLPTVVLVASAADEASSNLAAAVIEEGGLESTRISLLGMPVYQKGPLLLAMFNDVIVRPPDLDEYFNPQAYIFLSRHSAESGIASLTAHTTGNFSEAKFGGRDGELAKVDPSLLKNYMIALDRRRAEVPGYELTLEGTHHGPTSLAKPVLFVELGSGEKNWKDKAASKTVARAVLESLSERRIWEKAALGFGGTHYPEKFNAMLTETEFALSFIVPKYALRHVDEAMMGQMIQKTTSPVKFAAMDWKGLGDQKGRVVALVEQFGLEVVRV
ncbi:MAG TPA: D-aminoacyl-tRNA deacylase [Nitrososphaerales archaeon]|nr:D-aminoacyl-tRNA deacylase [Nitrososphaerales archaeon]